MSYRDDERRWKRMQEVLAAEASGRHVRAGVSQRTLFGIPSTVEQAVERIVAEDEAARKARRARRQADGGAERVEHPIDPVFDGRSRVLLLGSMPSPKSREVGFYYGNPRNRFWGVLAALFDEPVPTTNERRRDLLLRHHIALWDVLASCDIEGASDASIENAEPNDLSRVLDAAPIAAVFCTGSKAAELYARLCEPRTGIAAVRLPSTSPANAAVGHGQLVESYRQILPFLEEPQPATLDVPDVVALERAIDAAGTSLAELMDRAGAALAYRVHALAPAGRVCVLCGSGNNGGDGWVAAAILADMGHAVTLLSVRAPDGISAQPARDAAQKAQTVLAKVGAAVTVGAEAEKPDGALAAADVIVDAILGTGFSGSAVKEPYRTWIESTNRRREAGALVVAADVPSGMSAQTGEAADPCVHADETVTMMALKPGLTAGAAYCGAVRVAPLAYLEPFLG